MSSWSTNKVNRIRYWLIFGLLLLLLPIVSAQASPPGWQDPQRDPTLMRDLYGSDPAHYYNASLRTSETAWQAESITTSDPPDWTQLAFQSLRNDNWDIYLIRPNGSNEVRLTTGASAEVYPALKHGCEQVLFVSDRDSNLEIYARDISGANLRRLSTNPASDTLPTWSPDGTQIAFQSSRTGNSDLFVMNADGSNVRQLTSSSAFDGHPGWSPDGTQIVFSSDRSGHYELWVMNADGSNQRQLTYGSVAFQPAWAPSGDKIAYTNDSDGDGWAEIWQINADGTAPTRLQDDSNRLDRWAPVWSPDGQWLAYIETNWVLYRTQWYWTYSYLRLYNPTTDRQSTPTNDNLVWKAHWASTDSAAPGPCIINLANQARVNPFVVAWSAEDVGTAGVAHYDAQVRNPPAAWQDFVSGGQTGSLYQAQTNEKEIEFRCRARDRAGNISEWTTASTTLDATNPRSSVSAAQCVRASQKASVGWIGYDSDSGIASYDIWMRTGTDGNWSVWQNKVTSTQAVFDGELGQSYYFRSQAHDRAGHTEPWQPMPQASVSFYSHAVSVTVKDNRDSPLADAVLNLDPDAFCAETEALSGQGNLYLIQGGDYALHTSAVGHGNLPTMTLNITQDVSLDVFLPPQDNLVRNGEFETGDLDEWSAAGQGAQADTTLRHSGAYALKLAWPATGTLALPYIVTQAVTLSQAMHEPTISLMYHLPQDLPDAFSVRVAGLTKTSAISMTGTTGGWKHVWADLSAYVGQRITLSFELNDAAASIWIDEVSIGDWQARPRYSSYFPLISASRQETKESADWTTLGYDVAHTGYNRQDAGASRYALAWSMNTSPQSSLELGQVVVADGVLVISNVSKNVIALDAEDGTEIWRRSFLGKYSVNPATIAHGAVYVQEGNHVSDSYLFCLDLYTGKQNWRSPFAAQWEHYLAPLVVGDAVYVNAGYYGGMYGYNAGSGTVLWYEFLEQVDVWTPAYAKGQLYTWIHRNFRAHDPASGDLIWSLSLEQHDAGGSHTTPVIADQTALVVDWEGLYAVDLDTRQFQWAAKNGNCAGTIPAVADGVVYALCQETQTLAAHRLADGALLWSFKGKADDPFINAPLIAGNHIYVASATNTYVLSRSTHEVEWQTDHGGWLTVANGFLYIAQADQGIYAYRAQQP